MEKRKWEVLYNRIALKYEMYYENYLIYRKHARKNKKKAKQIINSIIARTSLLISNNPELGDVLVLACYGIGVSPKLIRKPEYYLEITEEVLKAILIKIDQMESSEDKAV